jgi:predicted site-specific integrase-resolvase
MQKDQQNRQVGVAALKEREAAILLGVSTKTLQAWRWKGTGPEYMKLGNGRGAAIRYEPEALEKFKALNTIRA